MGITKTIYRQQGNISTGTGNRNQPAFLIMSGEVQENIARAVIRI
jgi:hypothetical protein